MELRSPDPTANPYIAFALLIYAGIDGLENGLTPPAPVNVNLFAADEEFTDKLDILPGSLTEAKEIAARSEWLASLPFDATAMLR